MNIPSGSHLDVCAACAFVMFVVVVLGFMAAHIDNTAERPEVAPCVEKR